MASSLTLRRHTHVTSLSCLCLGSQSGVDQSVLIGWAGALSRFFVRGSVGPPVSVSCGFPEGCGLSCVAMMLIDQVWHEWVKADVALAQPLSFVDNWEILVSQPELVEASMDSTFRFAAALDWWLITRRLSVGLLPVLRGDLCHSLDTLFGCMLRTRVLM